MKHLRYDVLGAHYAGESRHPEVVMKELGIEYKIAIPQSMADQWWLFDCNYTELPSFIKTMIAKSWIIEQYKLPKEYSNVIGGK